ncbi:MAG: hypothetical protein AB8B56_17270, partial [Crocinitomicaceae bacterium]
WQQKIVLVINSNKVSKNGEQPVLYINKQALEEYESKFGKYPKNNLNLPQGVIYLNPQDSVYFTNNKSSFFERK